MKKLRLLVTRIDRIGDVVLSTPIPREVKKKYPGSFIAVLVREQTKDIFINNPYVDEIIVLNEEINWNGFWKNVRALRKFNFTHAFMLLPQERLNWILFFSFIPTRIGVGHKLYQFLTLTRYVDRKKYIEERHEADYCLDMVRKIGIEPESIYPEIYLSENEWFEVQSLRRRCENGKKIIGINSSSGRSAPNLKSEEYKSLVKKLISKRNFTVVITDNQIPDDLKNLPGVTYPHIENKIRNLIKVIAALDVLVSASTGPMHIASALKVPTISLFCPLPACSPKLWGPLGNRSLVILPDESYCNTVCPGDPKKCYFEGEGGINSEKILSAIKKFLESD